MKKLLLLIVFLTTACSPYVVHEASGGNKAIGVNSKITLVSGSETAIATVVEYSKYYGGNVEIMIRIDAEHECAYSKTQGYQFGRTTCSTKAAGETSKFTDGFGKDLPIVEDVEDWQNVLVRFVDLNK